MILQQVAIAPHLMEATKAAALEWHLPIAWLVAQIWYESDGYRQYAKRVEPGFLRRYGDTVKDYTLQLGSTTARLWDRNPIDFCSSYGLMQIMWSTAYERGFVCVYPSELFAIHQNLYYGCAELHRQLVRAGGDLGVALDAYNDGRINARGMDGELVDVDYTNRIRAAYGQVWGVSKVPDFPVGLL